MAWTLHESSIGKMAVSDPGDPMESADNTSGKSGAPGGKKWSFVIGKLWDISLEIGYIHVILCFVFIAWLYLDGSGKFWANLGRISEILIILHSVFFLHEMGHAGVARLLGGRDIRIIFVAPIMAATQVRDEGFSLEGKALFYLAGPFVNLITGGLLLFLISFSPVSYHLLSWGLYGSIGSFCYISLFVGCFNLLVPFSVFDGGRILETLLRLGNSGNVTRIMAFASVSAAIIVGWLTYTMRDPWLGFVLVLGTTLSGVHLWVEWEEEQEARNMNPELVEVES